MDAVRSVLFQTRPLPELALLLIVAILLASAVRTLMVRNETFKRASANIVSLIIAVVLLVALIGAWTSGVISPTPRPVAFEAARWRSQPWIRARMARELVGSQRLEGLTHKQVVALLGDTMDGSLGPESWMLYRPSDTFVPFPPELVVHYDKSGKVDRTRIEPGLVDVLLERRAL